MFPAKIAKIPLSGSHTNADFNTFIYDMKLRRLILYVTHSEEFLRETYYFTIITQFTESDRF